MNDERLKMRVRRAEVRVIRPGDAVDLEREDAAFWLRMTPAERVEEAWRLSEELFEWKAAGDVLREAERRLKDLADADSLDLPEPGGAR